MHDPPHAGRSSPHPTFNHADARSKAKSSFGLFRFGYGGA
ncbi:hypothetical protein HMPREF0185_00974 [Brevundimonas diminuta 470-4]|nr:hypothetical protein HMPREF0185_00974 [Brevundimonas diminuta 470-4]